MVEIVGVPFDLCGSRLGSRMGPAALRLAGLEPALQEAGQPTFDTGDIPCDLRARESEPGLTHFTAAFDVLMALKERVSDSVRRGSVPLILGGDHAMAIGSVAGALSGSNEPMAVLWIDAHADLNTPGSSPSGNLHGMSVAALLGLHANISGPERSQWDSITHEVVGPSKLAANRIAWFGLRDVDAGEREHIRMLNGCLPCTMHEVDRFGVLGAVTKVDEWLRASGVRRLWISFDIDVLDPVLAPGTGTAVRGGLTYREGHLLAELLFGLLADSKCPYRLSGLDVVETNPIFDAGNATAQVAVEWLASLFGKSILG